MSERYSDKTYKRKVSLALTWGLPWSLLGLLLCATIVFSPLGLACFVIAAWPLYKQQKTHLRKVAEWQNRDRPMPTDAMPPWLMEPEAPTYVPSERIEPDA